MKFSRYPVNSQLTGRFGLSVYIEGLEWYLTHREVSKFVPVLKSLPVNELVELCPEGAEDTLALVLRCAPGKDPVIFYQVDAEKLSELSPTFRLELSPSDVKALIAAVETEE